MLFDYWMKSWIVLIISSSFGLTAILASPARDQIANYTILIGYIILVVVSSMKGILKFMNDLTHQIDLTLNSINVFLILIIIFGMITGRFLATWTPLFFLPFSYYLFVSGMTTLSLYISVDGVFKCAKSIQISKETELIQDGGLKVS